MSYSQITENLLRAAYRVEFLNTKLKIWQQVSAIPSEDGIQYLREDLTAAVNKYLNELKEKSGFI